MARSVGEERVRDCETPLLTEGKEASSIVVRGAITRLGGKKPRGGRGSVVGVAAPVGWEGAVGAQDIRPSFVVTADPGIEVAHNDDTVRGGHCADSFIEAPIEVLLVLRRVSLGGGVHCDDGSPHQAVEGQRYDPVTTEVRSA